MDADALLLSRIQFAFTIGYHIIFPTLSMGLALLLTLLEGLWLGTKNPTYLRAARFWSKFFALSFGMGVISGVVLSYEIGTNWGEFSEYSGNIIGPLMSYEVMSAFFLEAGFLGIMLFGWKRVGPKLHFFSTLMVLVGTAFSAFWILAANSWMHTPAGYQLIDGQLHATSWFEVIFNPSFPYRFAHMMIASWLTTAFVVAGVSAWMLRNKVADKLALRTLRLALIVAGILAPLQVFVGDLHGLNTKEHQPMKVAAMEGHWQTGGNVPLLLFAIPDQEAEKNHFEIAIPDLASVILTHSRDGVVQGLNEVPADERPNVLAVFWSFRVMVGLGMLMLALAWMGLWYAIRHKLPEKTWYLCALTWASPAGFFAVLAGWITTEMGRQPWVIQGLMKTADGASLVPANEVAISLSLFVVVYLVLFVAFLTFFRSFVRKGPISMEQLEKEHDLGRDNDGEQLAEHHPLLMRDE